MPRDVRFRRFSAGNREPVYQVFRSFLWSYLAHVSGNGHPRSEMGVAVGLSDRPVHELLLADDSGMKLDRFMMTPPSFIW